MATHIEIVIYSFVLPTALFLYDVRRITGKPLGALVKESIVTENDKFNLLFALGASLGLVGFFFPSPILLFFTYPFCATIVFREIGLCEKPFHNSLLSFYSSFVVNYLILVLVDVLYLQISGIWLGIIAVAAGTLSYFLLKKLVHG